MKLKFSLKLNQDFTNECYLHSTIWKSLYNFKIKSDQEARHNQFFFQNAENNEIFEIFKMFKSNSWINFTTQKANACSPWTAYSVFNRKYLLWVNLVQKLKIISASWNFVPRLIQIHRTPCWCSLFLFLTTGHTFLGKFGPRNQNCQPELKFCYSLIGICRIMYKICGIHFFCFRPEKPFLDKSGQKNHNYQFKLKFGTKTNLKMQNSMMMFTLMVECSFKN